MTGIHREISPEEITDNTFKLIGTDWMLVTAGTTDSFNTMTASWGGLGVLWNRKVAWCVIRPHRHTYQFTEKSDTFTLTFFEERHRDILKYCGTKSGRDVDKIQYTGLTPLSTANGSVYFEQARLVLECRKIYIHDLDPTNFLDARIHDEYPDKDYHRLYMSEVICCLSR